MTTILQILPALNNGGVERGTIEVAAALAANGHRALVASAGGLMMREVDAVGGQHIRLPLDSKNPFVMWQNIDRIRRIIRRYKVDIVHARSRAPAWSAYYAARRAGVPYVTTFHNAYGAENWFKRIYNTAMAKGDRVIAISHFVADYIRDHYRVPENILRIIPRGVDTERFDPAIVDEGRVAPLRQNWNLPAGKTVILLPGRFSRWKGQQVLVAALAKLGRQDIIAAIVGGGSESYGDEIRRTAEECGVVDRIRIVDTFRDMPAAYAVADIVTSTSTRPEGFGRVVIEAQAMERIVIATDHGGAKETVIHNETGFLVPPNDPDALAAALSKALNMTPAERKQMGARARQHMIDHYTTDAMTKQTMAVYAELMDARRGK